MRGYKNSTELYEAGYAIPQYDISTTTTRTWRHKDKIFTTPHDVPVQTVMWNARSMDVLPMEKTDESSTR
jgi:hypothetical protein